MPNLFLGEKGGRHVVRLFFFKNKKEKEKEKEKANDTSSTCLIFD
jgi:hypothetical protein